MSNLNPAQRRYQWRFFPLMAAYMLLLFLADYLIAARHPGGTALTLLSVLPALPLVGVIVVLFLYLVEERDEFLRQRSATAMLLGTGLLLAVATVWGFLTLGGVAPQPPVYLAFPFWCVGFAIGQGALSWRDRIGAAR